jgi:phosphohistidine swiveling domain-containing protein
LNAPEGSRGPSLALEDLSAFAALAWEMLKRPGLSAETLLFLARSSRRQFEAHGGTEGLRSIVADMIGGPNPRPKAPPQSPSPRHGLFGVSLSAGRAEGAARIFRAPPTSEQLLSGEVLVCTHLDSDTAARLDRRSAVVVEAGSAGAGPLQVARNRGIPVVRLPEATSLIPEGTLVSVDGSLGRVDISPT